MWLVGRPRILQRETVGGIFGCNQPYDGVLFCQAQAKTAGIKAKTDSEFCRPQPHGPTSIGPFTITHDADSNQITTLATGTNSESQYLYDEEDRLACANKGPQTPTPSCNSQGPAAIPAAKSADSGAIASGTARAS